MFPILLFVGIVTLALLKTGSGTPAPQVQKGSTYTVDILDATGLATPNDVTNAIDHSVWTTVSVQDLGAVPTPGTGGTAHRWEIVAVNDGPSFVLPHGSATVPGFPGILVTIVGPGL